MDRWNLGALPQACDEAAPLALTDTDTLLQFRMEVADLLVGSGKLPDGGDVRVRLSAPQRAAHAELGDRLVTFEPFNHV